MNAKLSAYIDSLPIDSVNKRRIRMTVACADTRSLPRVSGAGEVFDGPSGRYQLMHNGIRVIEDGYIGRWVTEIIKLLKGAHEPQEEKAFAEVLKYIPENGVMLELGSWWSYYSLWFQKEIKNAQNYMIEPDPNNLEVGRRNFALNGMEGSHFFNFAIGKESIDSIIYRCYESDNVERPIQVVSVDDFVAHEEIRYIDLLLCDIQGFELEMLEGAIHCIEERKFRFMLISTHHHEISKDPLMHQKCLMFLQDHGARILLEHTVAESYSGDGLIVASLYPPDRDLPAIQVSRNLPRNSLFREAEYDLADAWAGQHNLESTIRALTAEHEAERQRLEAALKATRSALVGSRSYQATLEQRIRALENDVANLRSESQGWWTVADNYHSALDAVYTSRWWRLTAPMRALHIKENIKRLIRGLYLFVRRIPGVGKLLDVLHRLFPRLGNAVAVRVLVPVPVANQAQKVELVEPPAPAQDAAAGLVDLGDEQHFLNLFERELNRRQAEKAERQS